MDSCTLINSVGHTVSTAEHSERETTIKCQIYNRHSQFYNILSVGSKVTDKISVTTVNHCSVISVRIGFGIHCSRQLKLVYTLFLTSNAIINKLVPDLQSSPQSSSPSPSPHRASPSPSAYLPSPSPSPSPGHKNNCIHTQKQ